LDDLPAGSENCARRCKADLRITTATFLG